ncbi:MAG: lipoyl synthase [Candidatus Marinimicrobia bacterium]|nr:lipoyl synthase [Candidatus Neomarinimicrobiota bacterium]MBL7023721.1 lipoyl synthase [Candidatus Neomarinimicrobiota bacterium]MBL7109502.1 lipoyl synthase [Candidatus Neomarinimicrobiota bacterium]
MSIHQKHIKRPEWLKIKLVTSKDFAETKQLIHKQHLNTVCESARCPNIFDCWNRKTATIMILGEICTRSCKFCSVNTGKPNPVDFSEPQRVAEAVKKMQLNHVVLTSVDRDDLNDDFGATIWAKTIREVRIVNPDCSIEMLTPDFKNCDIALKKVFDAKPDIFSHNIETVERISKLIRPQSDWNRSIEVLQKSVDMGLTTKTGMMVGLGETDNEVLESMQKVVSIGVEYFNIGQYLQPTKDHLTVQRYVHPDIFEMYKSRGLEIGFRGVESAPLVRSSYHADEQVKMYGALNKKQG